MQKVRKILKAQIMNNAAKIRYWCHIRKVVYNLYDSLVAINVSLSNWRWRCPPKACNIDTLVIDSSRLRISKKRYVVGWHADMLG